MANKRKRESASTSRVEETSETGSTDLETVNGNIAVADRVYEVQVYKDGKSVPKKPRSGEWSELLEQEGWEVGEKAIHYRMSPISDWDGMKRYKNFVVSSKTFGTGDFVFIYHGNQAQGANLDAAKAECWVAKVLEIRARDQSHVFLRILWMFWPEELPKTGRLDYHAQSELIASNFMDIVDAMTVTDKAEVSHVEEKHNEPPIEGLFWRQKFDYLTNRLTTNLRRDCHCGNFHNPDKKLIYCQKCKTWLHETCLLNEALNRFSIKRERKAQADAERVNGEEEVSDTIMVDGNRESKVQEDGNHVASPTPVTPSAPTPKTRRKSQRKSSSGATKAAAKILTKPAWEGKLEARLEMKLDEAGEETEDATGKVIITDIAANEDEERETFKEDLLCVCCDASLAEQTGD